MAVRGILNPLYQYMTGSRLNSRHVSSHAVAQLNLQGNNSFLQFEIPPDSEKKLKSTFTRYSMFKVTGSWSMVTIGPGHDDIVAYNQSTVGPSMSSLSFFSLLVMLKISSPGKLAGTRLHTRTLYRLPSRVRGREKIL